MVNEGNLLDGENGALRLRYGGRGVAQVDFPPAFCFFGSGVFQTIIQTCPLGIRGIEKGVWQFTGFCTPPCLGGERYEVRGQNTIRGAGIVRMKAGIGVGNGEPCLHELKMVETCGSHWQRFADALCSLAQGSGDQGVSFHDGERYQVEDRLPGQKSGNLFEALPFLLLRLLRLALCRVGQRNFGLILLGANDGYECAEVQQVGSLIDRVR